MISDWILTIRFELRTPNLPITLEFSPVLTCAGLIKRQSIVIRKCLTTSQQTTRNATCQHVAVFGRKEHKYEDINHAVDMLVLYNLE